MKILVLNCGSSSVKYQLFDMPAGKSLARGVVERIGEGVSEAAQKCGQNEIKKRVEARNHEQAIEVITGMLLDKENGPIASMAEIGACGHRAVHGGEAISGTAVVDDNLEQIMEKYADLAPLHNPPNLIGMRAARKILGAIPQVAAFDTAFHQTIPEVAYLYALPYEFYEKHGIRRYGFHGISHRYVTERAAVLLGVKKDSSWRAITCHLGNGCSMAAVRDGKSVDTTMGMTPLDGLVMGTRPGDTDPGIIFYLLRKGYSPEQLDHLFNKKSGLFGISGSSNDVRDLEARAVGGDKRAKLALDMFAYRIRKYIGAYLAILNGANCIIFTGGIGENNALMRKRVLGDMENLGIGLDNTKNTATQALEAEIQSTDSRVKIFIIPTNEEGLIALDTYTLVTTRT